MAVSTTIPDIYTTYLDFNLGNVTPSLANIVGVVGSADRGIPGTVYSFSGSDAKNEAKTIFGGGVLLEDILRELDAGGALIYATRAGAAVQAQITLDNTSDADALLIKEKIYSADGNNLYATVQNTEVYGTFTVVLTIEDQNVVPFTEKVFTVTGSATEVTPALMAAINLDGTYIASLEAGSALPLKAVVATAFAGGDNGTPLVNADYTTAFEQLESKTDIAVVKPALPVELDIVLNSADIASVKAIWTIALTHCATMLEDYRSECWALLEVPKFITSYDVGTAGYITDRQTYTDAITDSSTGIMSINADKNGVVFAGGASILNSDSEEEEVSIAASCMGRISSLQVQQSCINKIVPGVLSLVPEFTPAQAEALIAAKVNFIRYKPGRGRVMSHSLTMAPTSSDYDRAEIIRTMYYAGKQSREAMEAYVGDNNDQENEFKEILKSAGEKPLITMKDNKQIDDYSLTITDVAGTGRRQVTALMGIKISPATEFIWHDVYVMPAEA